MTTNPNPSPSQAEDVLIFDEAHNMERACTDAASFDLSAAQLVGCVKEVDRCIQGAQNSEALDQVATVAAPEAGEWLGMKQAPRAQPPIPTPLPADQPPPRLVASGRLGKSVLVVRAPLMLLELY